MDFMHFLIDFILHVDAHLAEFVTAYGMWVYGLLFLIVFAETGFVVTPFLPGDSLLFVAGALAAVGLLKIEWLVPLLIVAAILGDTVNYWMGKWIGERAFKGTIPFLKKQHLDHTQKYFEKYGAKTIIIARFVPLVRTFAPFVAGIGSMKYTKFIAYNIIGGIVWVSVFLLIGYAVGNIPVIKNNFKIITVVIILVSVLPILFEWMSHRARNKKPA